MDSKTSFSRPLVLPDDEYNQTLIRNTHPQDWVNRNPSGRYDLVVIGAGTAGLSAAGGCAAIGGRVALIERYLTGGDCLVTGCVPSKGIISAARVASMVKRSRDFGIRVEGDVKIDFAAVMQRMRKLRAQISPADSVQHMSDMGVEVFLGEAKFNGRNQVEVDGKQLVFKRAVIASGARAYLPPIPGLKESKYLTNETLFELTELPRRMAFLGAGPIGCEMAQAFRRLGSEVILINKADHILSREDADAAQIVQQGFDNEGIQLVLSARVIRIETINDETTIILEREGKEQRVVCDVIVVGVGRAPNVDGLGLEAAGVSYDKHGVHVDDKLRTSNPHVYAAGDICVPFKFTHTANVLGRMAMTNAFFWGFGGRISKLVIPWCTYTEPEIAHVGLYEKQATDQGYDVETLTVRWDENDRAVLDGEDHGFMRVHLKRGTDTILGATIVASHAGDLLSYFTLAMNQKKGLSSLAAAIYPYPTQSELIKKLVGMHMQKKLTPMLKHLLKWGISISRS